MSPVIVILVSPQCLRSYGHYLFINCTVAYYHTHILTPVHYHLLFLSGLPLIPLIITIGVAFGFGSDYYVVTSDEKLMYVVICQL